MNQPFATKTLGSKKKAEAVAQRAQISIPVYQYFLTKKGVKLGESLDNLPTTDKKSYISVYSLEQLLDPDYNGTYTIFCSAGTSGKGRSLLPNLVALVERGDKLLNLCGHRFSKSVIDEALACEKLVAYLTRIWTAKIDFHNGHPYMKIDLETHSNIFVTPEIAEEIYYIIIHQFCLIKGDFKQGWETVYSVTDNIPDERIIRLNFLPYPTLSQKEEKNIKHQGIIRQ
jgi:hypothetical protein